MLDCREPDDDWQEKERLVEEAVERLDIVIVDSDPRLLLQLVNPHYMSHGSIYVHTDWHSPHVFPYFLIAQM